MTVMAETNQQRNVPPSRRRDKPQLSCNLCRRRKLRCDRGQPCGSCIHRGLSVSCTYAHSSTNGAGRISKDSKQGAASSLTDRIEQLEKLITSFAGHVDPSSPGRVADQGSNAVRDAQGQRSKPLSNGSEQAEAFGRIRLRDSKATYVEGTHWTAILDGIHELKDSVQDTPEQLSNPSAINHRAPELLFAGSQPATKEEILRSLPSREITDRIVAEYFCNKTLPLIHGPSFLRAYEKFWKTPHDAPMMWIGKLYGVMCLSLLFQHPADPDSLSIRDSTKDYSERISQCLVLGNYQNCPPDTIETLLLALNVRFLRSGDAQMDDLIFLGIIVRMAQRMGYHRDPSHFSHISPFQGEMRRRVWSLIVDLDVLASAQVGLPRLLREFQSDTTPPRNILDDDFDEDTTDLPPPRPSSFETPTQWLVAKNKLISMFGIITDLSTSIRRPAYAEVMRMDKLVHETYASIPENLRERPMRKSLMDSPDIIFRRIQLVLLLEKAKCVLHYRYLAPSRADERFAFSRTTCIESALHVLDYHFLVDQETKPGGRLFKERWKAISPMIRSNFLLATTLLCLELNFHFSIDPSANPEQIPLTGSVVQRILQALRQSYTLWVQLKDTSNESGKTVQVLDLVLGKAHKQVGSDPLGLVLEVGTSTGATTSQSQIADETIRLHQSIGSQFDLAMPLNQAMYMPQMQDSHFQFDNIPPELLDITHSVDEMLGLSMNYPRLFEFPLR